MNKLFISLLLVISMNGCVTDSSATNEASQSGNWIDNADPKADALAALERRDFRFMALSLRGTVIPGVESTKSLQFELRCGVNFMRGVSDAVRNPEQVKSMQKIHDYAAKYNAVIKTRCNF
ncbi:MAG: hypothetical protein HOM14_10370 [Gammaproteobacteria bacterium]|jgi:hypothetical protein|nr:hypothetical protein [Gammaproteobacteria bacterium]MBT6456094.1 hypothetical protein [Gammaproteobacteria bacterium]MBT6551747.1 hypothetical protein [Gammaproteobacteria bacterium]MBT7047740.1 hypothetical protein [Gammaproteobacteria bacterium]